MDNYDDVVKYFRERGFTIERSWGNLLSWGKDNIVIKQYFNYNEDEEIEGFSFLIEYPGIDDVDGDSLNEVINNFAVKLTEKIASETRMVKILKE